MIWKAQPHQLTAPPPVRAAPSGCSYLLDLAAGDSESSGSSDSSPAGVLAAPAPAPLPPLPPPPPRLRSVPSSRSEVFQDRGLSLLQKRCLMRFLKAAAEALEGEGPLKVLLLLRRRRWPPPPPPPAASCHRGSRRAHQPGAALPNWPPPVRPAAPPLQDAFGLQRPVTELLQQQGLDARLQQSLLHGVLLHDRRSSTSPETMTAVQALERLRLYVQSAGRYGPDTGARCRCAAVSLPPHSLPVSLGALATTCDPAPAFPLLPPGPFLVPLYGCGELAQAFCRAAAVAGAVQVLRCGVRRLLLRDADDADAAAGAAAGGSAAAESTSSSCYGVELTSGQVRVLG